MSQYAYATPSLPNPPGVAPKNPLVPVVMLWYASLTKSHGIFSITAYTCMTTRSRHHLDILCLAFRLTIMPKPPIPH